MADTLVFALTINRSPDIYVATEETYVSGNWHQAAIAEFPSIVTGFDSEYRISDNNSIGIRLADPQGVYAQDAINWQGLGCTAGLLRDDVQEYSGYYVIDQVRARRGEIEIELVDAELEQLETLWPPRVYQSDDVDEETVGQVIPEIIGDGLGIRAVLVNDEVVAGQWDYAVCEHRAGNTVLSVYRSGVLVNPAEYSQITLSLANTTVTGLRFTAEQRDSRGAWHVMTADVRSPEGRNANAADELYRVADAAGLFVDVTAAKAVATTELMLVDYAYLEQRTTRAWIDDLLLVLRASMVRKSLTELELIQDVATTSSGSYSEIDGDMVSIDGVDIPQRPKSIKVQYYQSQTQDYAYDWEITVPGGGLGETLPFDVQMIQNHEAAHRLTTYLAERYGAAELVSGAIYGDRVDIGERYELAGTTFWSGSRDWKVWRQSVSAEETAIEWRSYVDSIYIYPGYPTDPATPRPVGYQPELGLTPPDPPTIDLVTIDPATTLPDGSPIASITVTATAPSSNVTALEFTLENEITNEVRISRVDGVVGSQQVVETISAAPGQLYTVVVVAISPSGIGSLPATDTTNVAAGDLTPPSVPLSITAAQKMGRNIEVAWDTSNVTEGDLREYVVERQVNAGGYVEFYRGLASKKTDIDVDYGESHQYRVSTFDFSHNQSGFAVSNSVTITQTVGDRDISPSDPIDNNNIKTTLYAKRFATSLGSTRVELNGTDNEFQVWVGGAQVALMGQVPGQNSDFATLTINAPAGDEAIASVCNISNQLGGHILINTGSGPAINAISAGAYSIVGTGIDVSTVRGTQRVYVGTQGDYFQADANGVQCSDDFGVLGTLFASSYITLNNSYQIRGTAGRFRFTDNGGQRFEMEPYFDGARWGIRFFNQLGQSTVFTW